MKISKISINKPISVLVLAVGICLIGILGFLRLPINLLPDITYPLIKVYVDWRGATPEEIEDNIAEIIEQKMATVDGLDYLESQCAEGQYTLLVNFDYSVDRNVAYQDVLAKMGLVRKKLPKDADEPLVIKADPSQLPVIDLIITSDEWDMVKLRTWVENYLQLQFTAVSGSAGTEVSGGARREIRAYLNPHKMQLLGITPSKVIQRIGEDNVERSAGRVIAERKDFLVRIMAEYKDINEIKDIVIVSDKYGRSIYLKDIADVKDAKDIQRIITRLNRKEGVKLSIFKQADANTIDVEKGIVTKLKELSSLLPKHVQIGVTYNQANYIRSANKGVMSAGLLAIILVVLITLLFLSDWRRALMIVFTLPVTLLGTFFIMKLLNFSINILSLGGLVVSFTVILDNSIVVLENITRLQNEKHPTPIISGVSQVGRPILFSTLTFMSLLLPFLMVTGLTSLLFRELVITIAVVIGFSLISSLAVMPALATLLGIHKRKNTTTEEIPKSYLERQMDRFMEKIGGFYAKILSKILHGHKRSIVLLALVILGAAIFSYRYLGSEFLPKADDGMITVKVIMSTGTAVTETDKVIRQIENKINELPYIENCSSLIGGKIWGLVTSEVANEGQVDIQLLPKSKRKLNTDGFIAKYGQEIQKSVKYPGAKVKVFHAKMKGIRQTGDYDVEIELHSPKTTELTEMYNTASKMMAQVKEINGVANIDISMDVTKPEYQIFFNRGKLIDLGFSAEQIANTTKTFIDGQIASQFKEAGYYYPIRVVVDEENFKGKEDVWNIPLFGKNGLTYLRDIGEVKHVVGPVQIDRKDQLRIIKVTGSVLEGSVGEITRQVYEKVKNTVLPAGSFLKLGGQAQMIKENSRSMVLVVLLGLFFAFIILTIQFESLLLPAIIILSIPFPLAGFIFLLLASGTPVGVTALVGVVVLLGMCINHWVLVLSFIEEKITGGSSLEEGVIEGAKLRLKPVIMTFLTDVLGLFPFLLNITEGTEMLKPLGVAVIGGITYSLFVTFFFLPVFYTVVKKRFAIDGR
jgi:hydrophobe/amphiphile efflux-1 (HAE1) family protein